MNRSKVASQLCVPCFFTTIHYSSYIVVAAEDREAFRIPHALADFILMHHNHDFLSYLHIDRAGVLPAAAQDSLALFPTTSEADSSYQATIASSFLTYSPLLVPANQRSEFQEGCLLLLLAGDGCFL